MPVDLFSCDVILFQSGSKFRWFESLADPCQRALVLSHCDLHVKEKLTVLLLRKDECNIYNVTINNPISISSLLPCVYAAFNTSHVYKFKVGR